MNASRDENFVTVIGGVSSVDGKTFVPAYSDPTTHRILCDIAGGSGSVTSVSVISANGFAGTVATPTVTPAITLSTTITGILKGNGTALSAATAGTDYSLGTSALATGILKSTTTTGALSIAIASDFPTLNQDTTGTAAKTNALNSATTVINVSSATAPTLGQVLTATSGTAATWQTPLSFTYPGAGVVVSTGSAWGTSLTAPSGTIVGTTDTQTLTNKTLTKPTINGSTPGLDAASDGTTVTFDCSAANIHTVTLGGNRTLALSNITTNQVIIIELIQDATGSRTVTWFTTIKWAGGTAPTLTTTASKKDSFGFRCTGSGTYDGYVIGQNI